MANKLQSPTESFASTLKAPSIPNEYQAFSGVLPGNIAKGVTLPDEEKAFAPFKKTPLPDDTKLYQDLNIKTGVGGYGEGHTVNQIRRGLNEKAFRPELLSELYGAKSDEKQLVDSNFETRKAKEEDFSLFKNTSGLNLESTLGDIKLSRMKAANDVNDFLRNPNSIVRKTFEKNLGKDKLELYNNSMSKYNATKEGLISGELTEDVNLERGIRGIRSMGLITAALDYTGSDYSAYLAAIEDAQKEGATGIINDWTTPTANLLGTGLMYGLGGAGVSKVLTTGLMEAGLTLQGARAGATGFSEIGTVLKSPALGAATNMQKFGSSLSKVGLQIDMMETSAPTLFAATVDNAFTTAIDYGAQISMGKKISYSDFTNDIIIGAATPVLLKGALSGIGKGLEFTKSWARGVTPRDISNLEKAIQNDMKVNGSTDAQSAMVNLEDSFKFSDNKTLGEKIAEYKAAAKNNPDAEVTYEQVMAEMAAKGVSISKGGAKRVAKSINQLNGKLKGDTEGARIGEMSADDNIQMTKKSVMQKLTQEQIVDSNKADDILSTTHKENGVEYKSTKVDEEDKLDDLMHNPEFSPTKLDNANTIDEVAKAVDGKTTKTTRAEIKEARENIDTNQNKGPEDVKVLAEKEGVPFNDSKAFDKVGLTNKEYLHKVLDDIEYHVIGFTKYAEKIRKNFTSRVKEEAKNIKIFGKYVEKFKGLNGKKLALESNRVIDGILSDVKEMTEKLKVVTNASEKNAIEAAIAKKNAEIEKLKISLGNKAKRELAIKQKEISRKNTLIAKIKEDNKLSIAQKNEKIAEIRQSNIDKNTARRSLIAFGKSEIDIGGNLPEYRGLSKQKINSIKNEFKARILNKSTNKELEKIIVDFHQKMYDEAYNTVDKQIEKTIKKIKSDKGGAGVDVQYRNKMIEVYNEFNSARDESDLVKMNEVLESIKSFAEKGRDVHKDNMYIRKHTTQLQAEFALRELEISGKDKYEARLLNTEQGNQGDTSWFQKLKGWVESNIQSQTQMTRMFEGRYEVVDGIKKWIENPLNKVFNIAFQRGASKVKLIESKLMDKWIPNLSASIQKGLGGGDVKSNLSLYHFWKVRNRGYGEYNMRDLIFLRKDSNGNWEYVPTMTPSRFRKEYSREIADGSVIDFYNSPKDIKQAALDSIYKRFDDMYSDTNSAFHKADNEWRAHVVENGLHLKSVMENEFNQHWIPDGDNYWPIIHSNKAGGSEIINDVGGIEASYRRSINDSFTKEMEGATGELNIYHDPVSIVGNHINGNIYYGQMIVPLRRAQSLLNLLRKGKNAINSKNIDILMKNITSDIEVSPDEMFSMNLLFKDEGASSDSLLTKELDRFLNDNLLKIASNGTSLKASVDMNASRALETVYQNLYHVALSGIGTPLKQPLSLLTTLTEGGSANMYSATRSWNMDNISILFDDSGTLYERMPPIVNREGVGKSMRNTSHESWYNRRGDNINDIMNNTVGNAIKTFDGGVSLQAFLVGASKYLDEVHPGLHTAGRELNLTKIKESLQPEQWEDLLGYSENFMDRVMSSQNKVNASLGNKNPINKLVFFLGKTGLNETTLFLENVHRLFQAKYGSEQKARIAVALLVTSYIGYNWNKNVVDVVKNNFDETVGAKTSEKIGDSFYSWSGKHIPKDKVTEGDRFAAGLVYFMTNKFIKPSTDFDIARTFNGLKDYGTKFTSYPTTSRKIEEGFYAATTMFIHRNIPDAGRFLVTKGAQAVGIDMDITKVGNASYDKEVNAIYSSILKDRDAEEGGNKPSMMEQFRGTTEQGYTIPTGSDLKPLIEEQSSITKAEDSARKQAKEFAKNKEAIEIGFKKSGGNSNDFNSFFSYALSHKDMLNAAGIKDTELVTGIQELYKKISGKDVSDKTTINLLKGKPLNIIFDVKIKPLLEAGSPKQLIDAEVGNLYQNKMFKSANGVQQMNQLITDYLIKR